MTAIPQRVEETQKVFQGRGTIVETTSNEYVVRNRDGQFRTRRAVSCLVELEVGDEVLFAGRQTGELYVLYVLNRPRGKATRLGVPGDLVLSIKKGRFLAAATEGIHFVSQRRLTTQSKALRINADDGTLSLDHLAYFGKKVCADIGQLRTVMDILDSTLDVLHQRTEQSRRVVEERDQVRAKEIDYSAKENLILKGKNTLVSAKSMFKAISEQICLG